MDIRIKLVPLILGGVFLFLGFQEWRLAVKAKAQPQAISARLLEDRGPGDNAHIEMSDFLICEWSFVYEAEQKRVGGEGDWKRVWIPVVPRDGAYGLQVLQLLNGDQIPPPPDVRIILKSNKVRSEGDVRALGNRDRLQGMVVNEIESLGSEEKRLLSESYQGIDFSKCYIVELDKRPAGAGQVMLMMGGGGTLALAGAAWLAAGFKKS